MATTSGPPCGSGHPRGTEEALHRPRLQDDVSTQGQLLQWQFTVDHRRGEVVEVAPEAVGVGPQERERVSTGHLETGVENAHGLPDQGPPVGRGCVEPGRTVRALRCRATGRLEDRGDLARDGARVGQRHRTNVVRRYDVEVQGPEAAELVLQWQG